MLTAEQMHSLGRMPFNIENDLDHAITAIDLNHALYGNFIGVQYVFSDSLEPIILKQAIAALLEQIPILAARYEPRAHQVSLTNSVPSLLVKEFKGHSTNHAAIGSSQSDRTIFVKEPSRRKVLKGRAPLSTFTLTQFKDGGCIFGVAINHMLTDASGFHKIMRQLANNYTSLTLRTALPPCKLELKASVFQFGTSSTKSETLQQLKAQDSPKPILIKGLLGRFVKSLIIKTMEKILANKPVIITFTREDIDLLKSTILEASGEDWISTNTALSAHFSRLMTMLSYGEEPQTVSYTHLTLPTTPYV